MIDPARQTDKEFYNEQTQIRQKLNEIQFHIPDKMEKNSFFCHELDNSEVDFVCNELQEQGFNLNIERRIY